MNRFFRILPLPAKLMLIGFLPLLFIIFLTLSLYIEKNQNLVILEKYIDKFKESANITRLIDNLQIERQYSYEYVLNRSWREEMIGQRIKTDSIIRELKSGSDSTLKNFENYSFLVDLSSTRNRIDSALIPANGVMHYYSATIFRLNTLNGVSSGNNAYLRNVYNDMMAQKLISEMITYLGLINANVYNILYNRQYVTETLMGTMPSYEVYKSYEQEFRQKASPEVLALYNEMREKSNLSNNISYLNKIFQSYKIDSTYNYIQWGALANSSVNDMRKLQMNLLEGVQSKMVDSYNEESRDKQRTLLILVLALVLVGILVAYTIHIINTMLNELKQNALKIARGESAQPFRDVPNDVIGSLARSISEIDHSNKQLAEAAHSIGHRDFNVSLEPRSSNDLLGNALLRMKENLQMSIRETEESREEFKKLADFMPQIVWTASANGYTDYYNKKWYEFTGSESKYGDESFTPYIHPDDVHACMDKWYSAVQTGQPYEIVYRIRDKSGNYRWFLGRAVPVRNAEDKIIKWFGTCTDIHDRKTKSEELESLIQQRTRELERSNDDLRQFAHVASHDLKEPIRKIRMFSSRLLDDHSASIAEEGKAYLDKIQEAAKRMATMIDGVLNYSVTTNAEHQFEMVNLNQVMEEIKQDLELVIQQKKASVSFEPLPKVKGIRVLIYQLFYNLLNNALKFSRKDHPNHITVTVRKLKGSDQADVAELIPGKEYYSITMKDEGIGFDPANSGKMFQLFSRLNPKDKFEGTGLGLALCKKIAVRHNGNIVATGKENEGASFTVYLPVP